MIKRSVYFVFMILVLIIILYYSIIPFVIHGEPSFMDKVKHFFAYFLLSFLVFKSTKSFSLAIFLTGIYGILMEALQFTIPFRNFDIFDILVNYFGAIFILPLKLFNK